MFRITGYDIVMLIASIGLILACLFCGGCNQRIISYTDPNGSTEIYYKSNTLASKEKVDSVIVKTPGGWLIMIGQYILDNDSVGIEFDPLTKMIRLKTGE